MRVRALACVVLLAACGGGAEPTTRPSTVAPSPSPAAGNVLPSERSAEELAPGRWRSPAAFMPAMTVAVDAGWRSAHGFPDMFDVVRPDPDSRLPRLSVAFTVAAGTDADAVVEAIRRRAGRTAGPVSRTTLVGASATAFDVRGGDGELYRSTTGGYGLSGHGGQRLRIVVARAGGVVLVAVVTVAYERNWSAELPRALAVLRSARLA